MQGVHEAGSVGMCDDGLDHRAARQPVGPGADGCGVRFDDAARALAVDDAHHDGARLGAENSATTGTPNRPM